MPDFIAYPNSDLIADVEVDLDDKEFDVDDVINVLRHYATEAEEARRAGDNPRDEIWEGNWDRYWGRYDNAGKASWQSTHVMPEVPMFVDRWAAAMREAMDRTSDWFTIVNAAGVPDQVSVHIRKAMDAILSRCSRTPDGQVTDFTSVFEDQMKLGAIMACCASVTWEDDIDYLDGWVRVSTVDPREMYYDPKGRGLFRKREYEIDKYELLSVARDADEEGEPIYDTDAILDLMADEDWKIRNNRETSSGSSYGENHTKGRTPIKMEEFLGTVIMETGEVMAENALLVVANERFLIRGPEYNPFDHQRDWIVFTPMVSVPLSIYGRSYMEDWVDVADAFIELTNLILDGTWTSTMKAFVANPDLLDDPTQLAEGISPNKIYETSEQIDNLQRFIAEIDLGTLPADAFNVWTALKTELREGAKLSEISLGQLAPNSRTTATEIQQVQQSGSSMIRTMARTIEARWLEPVLHRVWMTALQHMDFSVIAESIGVEVAQMFNERRADFMDSAYKFQVRGISGIVDRQQKLQNLITALRVIGQNELLAQQLFQEMSPARVVNLLLSLFNIDKNELMPTQRERLMNQLQQAQAGPQNAQGQQPQGAPPTMPQSQGAS